MFSYNFFSTIYNNIKIASYSISSDFAKTATDFRTHNTEQPTRFEAENNSCHQLRNCSFWQQFFFIIIIILHVILDLQLSSSVITAQYCNSFNVTHILSET